MPGSANSVFLVSSTVILGKLLIALLFGEFAKTFSFHYNLCGIGKLIAKMEGEFSLVI